MPRITLNARSVGALKPRPGKDQEYFWDQGDGAPPGFGVRISAQAAHGEPARTYVLAYRIHGRQRFYRLGSVEALGLAEARSLARKALEDVARGTDPQARRSELREAGTVAALVGEFVDRAKTKRGREKAAATKRLYRQILRAHVDGSDLGRASVATVTGEDVRAHLETIARQAPVMANRCYQLIKAAFAWGIFEHLVDADPCRTLREPRPEAEKPGDRVLSDDELRLVWQAVDATDDDGKRLLSVAAAAAIRVLILLGTRRGETLRMRWQDLNLDLGRWSIPGEFRKGGEPLVVPLSTQAIAILEALDQVTRKGIYVFAGRDGAPLISNPGRLGEALRAAIRAHAKDEGVAPAAPFTLHDLRRTCATGCGELGSAPHIVALILGHKTMPGWGNVTGVYDRAQRVRDVAPWLQRWGNHVETIVTGKAKRGADVVRMGR